MNKESQMLQEISVIDFALKDLILYLDTHPYDRKAMEYFNHYNRIKNRLSRDFSMQYYPLTTDMADSTRQWRWGMAPLPWEGGCD